MESKRKTELRKQVGAALRYRRVHVLHLSLRELSYGSDLDYSKLGKIEKGLIDFRFDTLLELAATYQIQPRDLLDFDIELE